MSSNIDAQGYKNFERDGYSNVAERYIGKAAHVTGQTNEAILDAVGVSAGDKLVDIACGPGLLSAAAVKRGAKVVGLDFAPNMVAVARKHFPEAEFREADAEALPFEAQSFDVASCSLGLLHFPDPEKAVSEVFRVLKPKGRYAFTCWTPPPANPLMGLIFGAIQAHGNLEVDIPAGPPLFRFGEPSECEKILNEAGFEDVVVSECPIAWPAESGEQFFQDILSSTGRLAPLLTLQTEDNREKIRAAMIEAANGYQTSHGVSVPSSILIAAGRKP